MAQRFLLLLLYGTAVHGKLVGVPSNVYVTVGDVAHMNCSTDVGTTPVDWSFTRCGQEHEDKIYESGYFKTLERYRIDDADNRSNLVIANVRLEDAGTYACIDEAGMGDSAQAELIVIENSVPVCNSNITSTDGVLADNSCHMDPDYMEYNCTVSYMGNVSPGMEWLDSRTLMPIDLTTVEILETHNNTSLAINQFVVKATMELNGTTFVCHIRNFPPENNHTCNTRLVTVLYALNSSELLRADRSEHDLPQCSIDSNIPNCELEWKVSAQQQDTYYLKQPVIHPNLSEARTKTMNYECLGECSVFGRHCIIRGITIKYISEVSEKDLTQNSTNIYAIFFIICFSVIICALLIWMAIKCRISSLIEERRIQRLLNLAKRCVCCVWYEERKAMHDEHNMRDMCDNFEVPFVDKMKRDTANLSEMLDVENGLIESLFEKDVLTPAEMNRLSNPVFLEYHELVSETIAILTSKMKFAENVKLFFEALIDTKQKHVKNYLTGNFDKDGNKCRPLTADDLFNLNKYISPLEKYLNVNNDFLGMLVKNGCISKIHMKNVMKCSNEMERSRKLLHIMARRSFADFAKFRKCLRITNQTTVLKLLGVGKAENAHIISKTLGIYDCGVDFVGSGPINPFSDIFNVKSQTDTTQPLIQTLDGEYINAEGTVIPEELPRSIKTRRKLEIPETMPMPAQTRNLDNEADTVVVDVHSDIRGNIKNGGMEKVVDANITRPGEDINENTQQRKLPESGEFEILNHSGGKEDIYEELNLLNSPAEQARPTLRQKSIITKGTKHYLLISSSLTSKSSDDHVQGLFTDIKNITSDFDEGRSIQECRTRLDMKDAITDIFATYGKQVENVVFVLVGEGSKKGFEFLAGQFYTFDDILIMISEQHSSAQKAGNLPNHVTVIFACSYGHCYTRKKFMNSMNVIPITDVSCPEIKFDQSSIFLSSIFPESKNKPHVKIYRRYLPAPSEVGKDTVPASF